MGALKRIQGVGQLEFTQFYRSDRDRCLRAVMVGVGDRQLAEDLVAEAFTRAWMSWQKVSRHPAPCAWIVRTALNIRVSWWRRRRRSAPWRTSRLRPCRGSARGLTQGTDAHALISLMPPSRPKGNLKQRS